jgi:hypothetical protein
MEINKNIPSSRLGYIRKEAVTCLESLKKFSQEERERVKLLGIIELLSGYIMEMINEEDEKYEIPVNIWDDYYEEGYIPDGKIQETYIYVEDDKIPLLTRKKYLEYLLDWINKNITYLDGVKMWVELYDSKIKYPEMTAEKCDAVGMPYDRFHFSRWEIKVQHMTHEMRYKLVDDLEKAKLAIDGLYFNIYSES